MSSAHNPYVFIHIGKTAGSSVRASLSDYFPTGNTCPLVFHNQIKTMSDDEKTRYELYCAHIGYELALSLAGDPKRVFSLLRDPVDRVLSLYFYWREVEGGAMGPKLAKELELEEFLESNAAGIVVDVRNTQTWQLAFSHDALTRKTKKKALSEDAIYERAIQNVESLGVIGVQEYLDQFIEQLNHTYRWTLPTPDRLNTTGNRSTKDQIPDTTRRRIQALNAMDLELYAHVLNHYVATDPA
jgi:hypothetical protein